MKKVEKEKRKIQNQLWLAELERIEEERGLNGLQMEPKVRMLSENIMMMEEEEMYWR
jgi:hypothetical protein